MAYRVLVVDDDNNIRLTVSKCLTDAGYDVDTAVDGHHGLKKLSEHNYDVTLLDMKMPDCDGLEVLRQAQGRETAFIMVTGFGTVETAVEAMKLGAVDYIRKPFSPEEMRSLVKSVIKRAEVKAEDATRGFDACIDYAKVELAARRWDEAHGALKRAIAMDPGKPEPWNLLGVLLEMEGQRLEALRMYRGALAIDPSYTPATTNLERATRVTYKLYDFNLGQEPQEDPPKT